MVNRLTRAISKIAFIPLLIPKRIKKDNSKLFVVAELRNKISNFLDIVMLRPRVVFITGANRGLGLEFVRQFLKLGNPPDHLFATCRDPERAEVSIVHV